MRPVEYDPATACRFGQPVGDRLSHRETENYAISSSEVVELRGFEPLTSAVRLQRSPI